MVCVFETSVKEDIARLNKKDSVAFANAVKKIEAATSINNVPSCKKLEGHKTAYRVRAGTYRLCFYYENGKIYLSRFLRRDQVYRFFP